MAESQQKSEQICRFQYCSMLCVEVAFGDARMCRCDSTQGAWFALFDLTAKEPPMIRSFSSWSSFSRPTGLADDFRMINGREYKNAKVSRVEPDGIVITFSGGISQSSSAATSINRATSLKV